MLNVRLVSKLFLSLVLGIGFALAWFQYDERFIVLAHNEMEKVFAQQFNTQFRG